ncbi:MAG: hypothetical protein FWD71_01305 [Oscillospiraceae bacterium]|nr:hypothetical protein [Oscillospiraceae bacterium]
MTLAENLTALQTLKQDFHDTITGMGADLTDVPFTDYPSHIPQSSSGGGSANWTRPADRPVKPAMSDNTILMLFGVGSMSPNDMAFLITTNPTTAGYSVDWGDGTVDTYNSNVKAEHIYTYSAVNAAVDSNGYKMVWITVTPNSGNISAVNLYQKHSSRAGTYSVPQVFEMYIQCPYMTGLTFSTANVPSTAQYSLLEIFSLDVNNITGAMDYLLISCLNLKIIEKLYIEKASVLSYFMQNCRTYNQPFPENVTFKNVTNYFINNCSSYNQPFSENVTFSNAAMNFMANCFSYNQPFPNNVIFPKAAEYFMLSCSSFNHTVTVDLSGRTSAIGTNFISNANYAQKGLRLLNMGTVHTALNISNSNMDRDALVLLFGDLADRTGLTAGTITITGCYGASKLSSDDRAIATSKNWNIVG